MLSAAANKPVCGVSSLMVKHDSAKALRVAERLAFDYAAKRLYWINARSDSVNTARYDGSDPLEILRGHVVTPVRQCFARQSRLLDRLKKPCYEGCQLGCEGE